MVCHQMSFLKKLDDNWSYERVNTVVEKNEEERESKADSIHSLGALQITKPQEYRMYLYSKGWYVLKPKAPALKEVESDITRRLDVSVLSEFILTPILGIKDLRTDKRIKFIGGIHGFQKLQEKIDENQEGVAFGLFPTSITQLMEIADRNQQMPPKSTWFEPKLRSGVVVRTF